MGWRRRREADGMEEGPERAGRRARAKNTHRETEGEERESERERGKGSLPGKLCPKQTTTATNFTSIFSPAWRSIQ